MKIQTLFRDLEFLMDWILVIILQVMFQPSLSVLLTVEAEQTMYPSEFGGDVVMGCRFQPKLLNPQDYLKVTWYWISSISAREVYRMDEGVEHLTSQDPDYRGRVRLLTDELMDGWVKLQVSRLKINDTGTYQCLVQTGEGADYKEITLSVKAPYKTVTKHIQKTAEGDEVLLTCQSEGHPESTVMWQNGHLQRINSSTNAVSTPDQLLKVTSEIRVRSSDKNNYTCTFTNDGYSAVFHIPDEMPLPRVKNEAVVIVLSMGAIMVVIISVTVIVYQRRKGCIEENLRALVKAHYRDLLNENVRHHLETVSVEELPQSLQNNNVDSVNLQTLLPDVGERIILEGPPGSGKMTVANILVSS